MKKTKKLIALISAASMILTSALPVIYAEETNYSINNSDYAEYVSTLYNFDISKEQVMTIFSDEFENDEFVLEKYGKNCILKDIYLQFEDNVYSFILEFETEDFARVFADVNFEWDSIYYGIENNADDDNAFFEETPYEEINNELSENGFESYLEDYKRCYTKLEFNNVLDSTSSDIINRFIFLYNKYGFMPKNYIVSSFDFTLQDDYIKYYDDNVTFIPKEQPYIEPEDKYESYDIDNDAYRRYLNSLGDRLNQDFVDTTGFKYIYKLNNNKDFIYEIENQKIVFAYTRVAYEAKDSVNDIEYRHFNDGEIYWTGIIYPDELTEEINGFLKENNLKAEFVDVVDEDYSMIAYDIDITLEEIMDICVKLDSEYGLSLACLCQELFKPYCDYNLTWDEACNMNNDNIQIEKTEAIAGDSNGDKILNVRDCTFIASKIAYGANSEIPQTADFNKDEKINVRDAAAIANFLAKK